jgi:hypothetical protein
MTDFDGTSHAFVALERDMVYHNNSTRSGGSKNKFSLLETIKNARNKKREKRQREMFCLETACTLMEASYQAYFPLPLSLPLSAPLSLPLPLSLSVPLPLSLPLSTSFTGREGSMYGESSDKRSAQGVEDNSRVRGIETTSGERKREEEIAAHTDAETDRHSSFNPYPNLPGTVTSTTSALTTPSSSVLTDHSASRAPHTTSTPPTITEPSVESMIPTSDPKSLPQSTDRPHTENRTHESLPPSSSSSSSSSPLLPLSTSPILTPSDPIQCLEDDGTTHTTHTAHTHRLSDTTSAVSHSLSEEKERKEEGIEIAVDDKDSRELYEKNNSSLLVEGEREREIEEEEEKEIEREQKTRNTKNAKQNNPVKTDGEFPVDPLNPPNPIGVDNRVLGPKMDLSRIGLRLLSSFESKEHATFGFVATTPLPPSLGPLKGKN